MHTNQRKINLSNDANANPDRSESSFMKISSVTAMYPDLEKENYNENKNYESNKVIHVSKNFSKKLILCQIRSRNNCIEILVNTVLSK
jgi:hypothetical protein